jgi:hypothetical protein
VALTSNGVVLARSTRRIDVQPFARGGARPDEQSWFLRSRSTCKPGRPSVGATPLPPWIVLPPVRGLPCQERTQVAYRRGVVSMSCDNAVSESRDGG